MTKVDLLNALKEFIEDKTAGMKFPEAVQKGDTELTERTVDVYRMRLPNHEAAKKYVPYVLVQYVNGKDRQAEGQHTETTAFVRLICAVWDDNEEEGAVMLLNLMERIRIELLKQISIGGCFVLDRESGIESICYPDDTAPYYAGEMDCTFYLPSVEREVDLSNE